MLPKKIVACVTLIASNLYAAENYKLENPLTKVVVDREEDSSIIIDSAEDSFESRNILTVNVTSFNDLHPDAVLPILIGVISGNPRHEGPLSAVCKAWNDIIHNKPFAQYITMDNPSYYADRDRLKAQYNNNESMRIELTRGFLKMRRVQEERRNVKIGCCMGIPCCTLLGTGLGCCIGFGGLFFDPTITFAIPAGLVVGLATGISIRVYYRGDW